MNQIEYYTYKKKYIELKIEILDRILAQDGGSALQAMQAFQKFAPSALEFIKKNPKLTQKLTENIVNRQSTTPSNQLSPSVGVAKLLKIIDKKDDDFVWLKKILISERMRYAKIIKNLQNMMERNKNLEGQIKNCKEINDKLKNQVKTSGKLIQTLKTPESGSDFDSLVSEERDKRKQLKKEQKEVQPEKIKIKDYMKILARYDRFKQLFEDIRYKDFEDAQNDIISSLKELNMAPKNIEKLSRLVKNVYELRKIDNPEVNKVKNMLIESIDSSDLKSVINKIKGFISDNKFDI